MYIIHNPDDYVSVSTHLPCAFHIKYPDLTFAGCTCTSSFGLRKATPEEKIENEKRRTALERRQAEAYREFYGIKSN